MTQLHVIKKCIAELNVPNSNDVQHYYDEVSRIVQTVLTSKMDQQFSENFEQDRSYVIDRVELELGEIPGGQFTEEFTRRLIRELARKTIRSNKSEQKQASPEEEEPEETTTTHRSPLALLEHFMLHGTLPWWADAQERFLIETHLEAARKRYPEVLLGKISSWVKARRPIQRLIQHVSNNELLELAWFILPEDRHKELYGALEESLALIKGAGHSGTGGGSENLRAKLWFAFLNGLMQFGGNELNGYEALYRQNLTTQQKLKLWVKHAFIDEVTRGYHSSFALGLKLLKWENMAQPGVVQKSGTFDLIQLITDTFDVPLQESAALDVSHTPEPFAYQRELGICRQWLLLIAKKENPKVEVNSLAQYLCELSPLVGNKLWEELQRPASTSNEETSAPADAGTIARGMEIFQSNINTLGSKDDDGPVAEHREELEATEEFHETVSVEAPEAVLAPDESPNPRSPQLEFEESYVQNSGLILLWPFLTRFFEKLGYLDTIGADEDSAFINQAARLQAVNILQYLVYAADFLSIEDIHTGEFLLPLNKVLCGMEPHELVTTNFTPDETQQNACAKLLQAVINHTGVLKDTSISDFQNLFLRRKGILSQREGIWLLRMERENQDSLIEMFPWSTIWLKLPWMNLPMRVEN